MFRDRVGLKMHSIEEYIEYCQNCGEHLISYKPDINECPQCGFAFSLDQRSYAKRNPDLYSKEFYLPSGDKSCVIKQVECLYIEEEILEVFGLFTVTKEGIECLSLG